MDSKTPSKKKQRSSTSQHNHQTPPRSLNSRLPTSWSSSSSVSPRTVLPRSAHSVSNPNSFQSQPSSLPSSSQYGQSADMIASSPRHLGHPKRRGAITTHGADLPELPPFPPGPGPGQRHASLGEFVQPHQHVSMPQSQPSGPAPTNFRSSLPPVPPFPSLAFLGSIEPSRAFSHFDEFLIQRAAREGYTTMAHSRSSTSDFESSRSNLTHIQLSGQLPITLELGKDSGVERLNQDANAEISKKSLNVDSPAFKPATLSVPGKLSSISSQAANAAPFTPRALASGTATPNPQVDLEPAAFNPAQIKEFTPQNYELSQGLAVNGAAADSAAAYDAFSMQGMSQAMPSTVYNPYLEEPNAPANAASYFQAQAAYAAPAQPLQYHLYAPIGPHKEDIYAYQKLAHDFFIPNEFREELQRKSEATRQVMPNSQLPVLDHYHTLVPLDTNHQKNATVFGFPTWVYKAVSSKNGFTYVLRRIEGFRVSNHNVINPVKDWKRVDNGAVVSVIDAFTTRAFGDSSLIFVYNYHPLSKTLVENHFTNTNRFGHRSAATVVPEQVLWSYIVQIASAIRAVHAAKLAVRCMDPSKVILTDKSRIRLNACSILDVLHFEADRPLQELQQEDFIHFGKLILAIATNNLNVPSGTPLKNAVNNLTRNYSIEFRDTITWLLTPADAPNTKDFNEFLSGISGHFISAFDESMQANDTVISTLSRELENGRLFRLMAKLGTINERPEYEGDVKWSEVGERYILKLFRDYVFHQVDAEGKPVINLAHILECLNKLDAGVNQQIKLVSRDEQDCLFVSYKELKKQVELAFQELIKPSGTKRY